MSNRIINILSGKSWVIGVLALIFGSFLTFDSLKAANVLITRSPSGELSDHNSWWASISSDGNYIAYMSASNNLVSTNTNNERQIFVYDQTSKKNEIVSVSDAGSAANDTCGFPCISADGRFVAFSSLASNLVEDDTNNDYDIFVYDRQNSTIERILGEAGAQANKECKTPVLSGDGRYLAFSSQATNLVSEKTDTLSDIYLYDRQTSVFSRLKTSSGKALDNDSFRPSFSNDGKFLTFYSRATNIVPNDTNNRFDVFVYDMLNKSYERVSVANDGTQGDNTSRRPTLSSDGRYVAFESLASNLVSADTDAFYDIFVYDRKTYNIEMVSVSDEGTPAKNDCLNAAISADGRYVAFDSVGIYLTSDNPKGMRNVYRYDREYDDIVMLSRSFNGSYDHKSSSKKPSISSNGSFVAYSSDAVNLVPGHSDDSHRDIYVASDGYTITGYVSGDVKAGVNIVLSGDADRTWSSGDDGSFIFKGLTNGAYTLTPYRIGFTFNPSSISVTISGANATDQNFSSTFEEIGGFSELISKANDGTLSDEISRNGAISGDARFVVFESNASNLVSLKTSGELYTQIYLYDRANKTVQLISASHDGFTSNGESVNPHISSDGRYVAFASWASNLVSGVENSYADIFVYDRVNKKMERILGTGNVEGDGNSGNPYISSDGRYVAFSSYADNLADGTATEYSGLYIYDRSTKKMELLKSGSGEIFNNDSYYPCLSSDGRYVAFQSMASNIDSNDTNGSWDIFVYDRTNKVYETISSSYLEAESDGNSTYPSISADGRYVAYDSTATNLVPNDTNECNDIFIGDRELKKTERLSVADDGTQANGASECPSISADGKYVAFESVATNLILSPLNGKKNIFVYDRNSKTIYMLNSGYDGSIETYPASSEKPIISSDGTAIVYDSDANNLVPDHNEHTYRDVYVASDGYSIFGTISGDVLEGVSLTLVESSETSKSTTSSTDGTFSFTGLESGTYTLIAEKEGYKFSPSYYTVKIAGTDATNQNFISSIAGYYISGWIKGGVEDVTVTLSGTADSTMKAESGIYYFTGLTNGTYVVTPSKEGYTFDPSSHEITIAGKQVSCKDFYAYGVDDKATVTMAVYPTGSGTLVPLAGTNEIELGESFDISATAATGYTFLRWTCGEKISVDDLFSASTTAQANDDGTITAEFTADSESKLILVSPNGGENWITGTEYEIKWLSFNLSGGVNLELYKDDLKISDIASSLSSSKTSYTWTVPKSLSVGFDYRIKVQSSGDGAVSDESDEDFYIAGEESAILKLQAYPDDAGTCDPSSETTVSTGTALTISTSAASGFKFKNWQVENEDEATVQASVKDPYSPITTTVLLGDATITAIFTFTGSGDSDAEPKFSKVQVKMKPKKLNHDQIIIKNSKLPGIIDEDDIDPLDFSITLMVDKHKTELTEDTGTLKQSGRKRIFTYKANKDAAKVKLVLNLDNNPPYWSFRHMNANLSKQLDDSDGLDIYLSVNGKMFGENLDMKKQALWKFKKNRDGENIQSISVTGREMSDFDISSAAGRIDSASSNKDSLQVSKANLDKLDTFDPESGTAKITLDNWELTLPATPKRLGKKNAWKYQGEGSDGAFYLLIIDFDKGIWKLKITKANFGSKIDSSDGIDVKLQLDKYAGGKRLSVDLTETLTYETSYKPGETYTLSGLVSGDTQKGVTLTLSQSSSSDDNNTTSKSNGSYKFSKLNNGVYTITPSLTGYTFSPTSQTVTISYADKPEINFTAIKD